jgi:serine/threonine protein kinase
MKRLRHPNIIKYEALYIDTKKRMGWLVMELVKASSLEGVILKSEDEVRKVMFQVMEALSHMHLQDVLHRDIKPDNILYDPETKSVKIVDFGISKRFRRRGALIELWTITGTLYYRAPEMFEGGYREGVDVWAAGVLLYKLLTGKTPFESEYHHQTIQNIRSAEFKVTPELEFYSAELKNFLMRTLKRKEEERPNSCTCLRDAWFSSLYAVSALKKEENGNERTFQDAKQGVNNIKSRIRASISLKVDFEAMSPTLQSQKSL